MTRKLMISIALACSLFLFSCGQSKKTTAAYEQMQKMQVTIDDLTAKQKECQAQTDKLTAANKSATQDYDKLKSDYEASNQKLLAMEAAAKQDEEVLKEMERKIEEATKDFADKGVEVYAKDRLIYVNMSDKLLYKSGSSTLGPEGKEALAAIASALNDYPDLKVVVVGNTDDQKSKNSKTDNLSLSTERANGVVRILRDSYKVDATRLTAAGQGKYNPIADNSTAEGRAKNRRTEIILRPDLLKLWESVQK